MNGRIAILFLLGILGVWVMPFIIRSFFPGLPLTFQPQPTPFYWVAESPHDDKTVLLQFYPSPYHHEVIAGDSSFLFRSDIPQIAARTVSPELIQSAEREAGIYDLELVPQGATWYRLSLGRDDTWPGKASFLYRDLGDHIQPVWATYSGWAGIIPILGWKAWLFTSIIWILIMCAIEFFLRRREFFRKKTDA